MNRTIWTLSIASALSTSPTVLAAAGLENLGGLYNAIILGNLTTDSGDTEGRLLVTGNSTFGVGGGVGYSVDLATIGHQNPANKDSSSFIGGGNVNANGSLTLLNSGVYGGSQSGGGLISSFTSGSTFTHLSNPQVDLTTGNAVSTGGVPLTSLKASFQAESTQISGLTPNGTITTTPSVSLNLNGTNPSLDVFDVTALQWGSLSTRNITAPAGSTVIVNISGSSVNLSGGVISLSGVQNSHVLFNYFQATTFKSSYLEHSGTIIAPFTTTADFTGGSVDGTGIFSGDVTESGGWEFHNYPYQGAVPEPRGYAVAVTSLLGLGSLVRTALRKSKDSHRP